MDFTVRVASFDAAHPWAKAGVMIRESLSDNSRNAFVFLSGSSGGAVQWRDTTGGATNAVPGAMLSGSGWMRLIRQGSYFAAYQSAEGQTWTLVGLLKLDLPTTAYIGLAVTSHDPSRSAAATFTDMSDTSSSAPATPSALPAPWASVDVGNPALAGAAQADGSTFTVRGAGTDTWVSQINSTSRTSGLPATSRSWLEWRAWN